MPCSTNAQSLTAPPSPSHFTAILVALWLCGVTLGLIFWARSHWQIRALVRTATPLDLNLPIPVMSSASRLEPGIFGIRKPVLLLPEGITDRLTPAQLDAVFAHELCHLRRRDNLTAAIHMVVEILFWFHPLVWWIRTQLVAERETACDEEVIRTVEDPQVYAEGILNVCRYYLESPSTCVSGVTGADLRKRINTILIARSPRNLNLWKRIVLATAALAAIAVPVTIGLAQQPQSQAEPRMAFEVASIKPNPSEDNRTPYSNKENPGGIDYKYIWISNLIIKAFHIEGRYQLVLPHGYQEKPWEIVAKAPANSRMEDFPLMLRSLLADRFHLTFHRETKEMQVYELAVAKGGSKLKEVDPPAHGLGGSRPTAPGLIHIGKDNTNIATLATALTGLLKTPVIDKTGLQGVFEIDFEYEPLETNAPSDALGPTVFDALEKDLGLKLEQRKDPVEVLVVDHLDTTPTEN